MANLRKSMDAGFWDLKIATPQSLDGVARSIPGDPIPLDGARASGALRMQQVSLLGNGFPLGIIPIWSPTPQKELGSFALHSLLLKTATPNWWLGLIGQFRPKKLVSSIKAELSGGDEWEIPAFRDVAWHFLDKSFYSVGLCFQLALTSSSSILLSTEKHVERRGRRSRAMLFHKGFVQRLSKDLWRQKETKEDIIVKTPNGKFWQPSYDICLKEPHVAISGIIGATCASWFGNGKCVVAVESRESGENDIRYNANSRSPFSLDIFGSVCYTFQHGKFRKLFGDITRIDARLNVASVSALAKRIANAGNVSSGNAENSLSSPRFNFILQQQVAGPIVFRLDSRFMLDSSTGRNGPHMEDIIFSLNHALRLLQSGKGVAWYSPKRKEGMIELRMFEAILFSSFFYASY